MQRRGLPRWRTDEEASVAKLRSEGDDRSPLREVGSAGEGERGIAGGHSGVMNAAIIAIGSEMLGPSRLDTNSLKIAAALEDFGVSVVRKSVVGDRLRDVVEEIRYSLAHADVLITTGGL